MTGLLLNLNLLPEKKLQFLMNEESNDVMKVKGSKRTATIE